MNPIVGWALAVVAVALGYAKWGWPGVLLALSLVVFWLLLQFSRAMRAMREASQAPVGHIDSAVMLHAKLRTGMRLLEILPLTRSLGKKLSDDPESFVWTDTSGVRVTVILKNGRCTEWRLERPDEPGTGDMPPSA